jgi:hypothetical protein
MPHRRRTVYDSSTADRHTTPTSNEIQIGYRILFCPD